MEKEKLKVSHYLSLSYKTLISNYVIHSILFLFEIYLVLMRIMEIFWNDFSLSIINENATTYNPLTYLLVSIKSLNSLINYHSYLSL